ncbi:S8 family serine peptidase [Streptomyces sp. B1866]|uniref:S8 family serine peptidase n=1 Tax=Streptomyces sp. B1866 TaxID=3075431 RepID=UPI0028918DEA|nr:S8 family serine peptidase [Streptomyces sp. B1866]MDT3399736.1 S8 family serine peptidase [Streptomyces sp. B1866]
MDYDTLSTPLEALHRRYDPGRPEDRQALAARAREELAGVVDVDPADPERPVRVSVTLSVTPGLDVARLRARGIAVHTLGDEGDTVCTADVPWDELPWLSERPEVVRISPAERVHPLMRVAREAVGVDAYQQATGNRGAGVLIGVIDSGISRLEDFRDGTGRSRVLRIWDQTQPHAPGSSVPYGREFTREHGDLAQSRDDNPGLLGHGTHVAGIAAGSSPAYPGVAPDANLVVVKSTVPKTTARVIDALRYVVRVARALRMPLVVNMSLGFHGNAHDGTDDLSRVVDQVSGPGRIVCCAAGNEAGLAVHAREAVTRTDSATIEYSFRSPASPFDLPVTPAASFSLHGWYAGSAAETLGVRVTPPPGEEKEYDVTVAVPPGRDPFNGDRSFVVTAHRGHDERPITSGLWKIEITGERLADDRPRRVDVWDGAGGTAGGYFVTRSTPETTVAAPACATSAIAVGSFTTEIRWVDDGGVPRDATRPPYNLTLVKNDLSAFSSQGPRRDGRMKPDLVAPGAALVSSLSDGLPGPVTEFLRASGLVVPPHHTVRYGTSMAGPFVAGTAALRLAKDPFCDARRFLDDLAYTHTGQDARKWGRGLLDLFHVRW